jgi:ABC-type transport system involved in multi-copper enzyme maturation permease subunit
VTDLFAADLKRLLWRQMTWVIGVLGVLIVVGVGVIIFVHTAKSDQLFATHTALSAAVTGAVIPLAFAGYILGASALGADYTSRALTTLLTWEPRRRLVLASRACASALVTAGLTVILLLALIVALLPSAIMHGTGGAPDGAWYLSMAALIARCVLFTAAMSVVGVSAAAIGRSTTAAVIGIVLYLVLIENAAFQVVPSLARWLLVTDAFSWIGQQTTAGSPVGHTIVTGGLLLAGGTAILCALATRTFEHRDVT